MFNPKTASGRKSAKPHLPSAATIPKTDPYPPIYPDGDGHAIPTNPTEKLIKTGSPVRVYSPPKQETEKRSVYRSPPPQTQSPSELERLRAENAQLKEALQNKDIALVRLMIEIERLQGHLTEKNHEIEHLRASQLRQNASPEREAQIRALLARIEEYEHRIHIVDSELQEWKYKYMQLEKETNLKRLSIDEEVRRRLEIEISHIRLTHQGDWEARYHQLLKEKQELESRLTLLNIELDRVNDINRHFNQDNDILRRRVEDLTTELARTKGSSDLQSQVILLSAEVERLNHLLYDKHHETDHLRAKVVEIEHSNARQIEQVKQAHMKESSHLDKWRLESQEQMKQGYENQMKELTLRFSNERAALEAEIRQLRNRITELEAHLARTNVDIVVNELNAKFIHERAGYEARIRELETKISLVAVELEREHAAADMRLREIESWRERYSRLESTKMEEIRTLISQQISLTKKVSLSSDETDRIVRLFKELESEQLIVNSKYQQASKELEDIRRNRASYVEITEHTINPATILHQVTTNVHTTNITSSPGSYSEGYKKSPVALRESYHHYH